DVLENVLNEFERRQDGCILVLDDVHELESTGARACLAYLVDHAPSLMKIVIATRVDPPLRIERLRAGGRVVEIRDADLSFTQAEAAELFAAHDLHLAKREVGALREMTDGWVC